MASPLYNRDILRLAASIAHHQRLENPDATAERRSPTCGSRVSADVMMDGEGRLSALGLDVSACALGQASASLLAEHAIGRSTEELQQALLRLRAMLTTQDNDMVTDDFWPGISILAPARDYPARHPSILLAFEVVGDAMADALRIRQQTTEKQPTSTRGKMA